MRISNTSHYEQKEHSGVSGRRCKSLSGRQMDRLVNAKGTVDIHSANSNICMRFLLAHYGTVTSRENINQTLHNVLRISSSSSVAWLDPVAHTRKCAVKRQNLTLLHVNDKNADQTANLRSLISAFVIRFVQKMIT